MASEVQEAKFRLAEAKQRVLDLQIRGKAFSALIRNALSQFTKDVSEYNLDAVGLHLVDLKQVKAELLEATCEIKELEQYLGQD